MVCLIFADLPSLISISVSTGIVVVVIALTIKLVIKLITAKATKNVSLSIPEPNLAAKRVSLKNPNILLPTINIETIIADFVTLFLVVTIYLLIHILYLTKYNTPNCKRLLPKNQESTIYYMDYKFKLFSFIKG